MMKKRDIKKISFLLAEAVIIFGSVYGAFVLEDYRSRNFERKVLIGKLNKLNNIITNDSILFEQHFGTSNTKYNNYYDQSLLNHQKALKLLETKNIDSSLYVYELHKKRLSFFSLKPILIKSNDNINSITDEFEYLIVNDSTMHYLDIYVNRTSSIYNTVKRINEIFEKVNGFGNQNYFVLSNNERSSDIIAFINHPFYYNSLNEHLYWMNYVKYFEKKEYDKEFIQIKKILHKEIQAQLDEL